MSFEGRIYFCDPSDSTLNDLVVSGISDDTAIKYITMAQYAPLVGGQYNASGYQIKATGEQIVPSWAGEAILYALGVPRTDRGLFLTSHATIKFESGASYSGPALGLATSFATLSCITIDNTNFAYLDRYYIGYEFVSSSDSWALAKKLGTDLYIRPTGIIKSRDTTSGALSIWRTIFSTEPIYEDEPDTPEDPFSPGGTTGDDETDPEGGDGTFENEEATIDPPALPSLSAITSGFIAVYNPTFAQLQSLGDYLWSDLFSLDTFKKLFSDPMQAILGLSIVPVQPGTANSTVVIGNVNTGISMPRCTGQFVTVDCGTVTLPEYWGGYLDYSPYTKVEIYLPYIGVRPLDTDEVMGKTLHVVYHVDILSGSCVCFIQCDNTIRYHYVGQCGASIPITANDWTRVVNGAVSIATALGVGVATLGAGAAAAGGVTAASMAGTGALVGGIASQVLASKPRVEHSGSLAGMGGLLGVQVPYIMVVRPRQAVPEGQNAFTGYPSFIRRTLSTVTGYTQVTGVHLVGLTCTDEEKKEIQAQLEAGVIL